MVPPVSDAQGTTSDSIEGHAKKRMAGDELKGTEKREKSAKIA